MRRKRGKFDRFSSERLIALLSTDGLRCGGAVDTGAAAVSWVI
jgi:hypothetical protein